MFIINSISLLPVKMACLTNMATIYSKQKMSHPTVYNLCVCATGVWTFTLPGRGTGACSLVAQKDTPTLAICTCPMGVRSSVNCTKGMMLTEHVHIFSYY